MSVSRSICLAVRDQLRASVAVGGLAIESAICDVMGDGRPAPDCGKWFYSVHKGARNNKSLTGDDSTFMMYVTISGRTQSPFDRIGTAELDISDGLEDKADAVWNCIGSHQWGVSPTDGVMNKANAYLMAVSANNYNYVEALYPSNQTAPEPVRADWFMATEEQSHTPRRWGTQTAPYSGFRVVVTFSGAVRYQRWADAGA